MKKAIVIGAKGYVGRGVVKELLKNEINVLAISREDDNLLLEMFANDKNLSCIKLEFDELHKLPECIEAINWTVGDDCVFYNFTWAGQNRLMDGTIEEQLTNVTYISQSLKIASGLGCTKFIDSGSIEETFAESYLRDNWGKTSYSTKNGNYAVSKMASRDMCNLLAYLMKIDYIHTRFSVVVDSSFSGGGYVSRVFKDIMQGNYNYEKPVNNNLFDIIDLKDLSEAYFLLGKFGKNKVDYYIGSGLPQTLETYFEAFSNWVQKKNINIKEAYQNDVFDNTFLKRDTNLDLSSSFYNFLKKIG